MPNPARTIHIFGSLNMDLVCQTARLPVPGETLLGQQFETIPGGKGANQAVAAARLGAQTRMVGRVGNDNFGQQLMANLQAAGVDTSAILTDTANTGIASIVVDTAGNNQIVVVPGANGRVNQSDIPRLAEVFKPGDLLLMQFEIPLAAVLAAAAIAKQRRVMVMVDPAPVLTDLPEQFYQQVDILTPNQGEASALVGFPVNSTDTAEQAAQVLMDRGITLVIIKLGAMGTVIGSRGKCFHQPAFPVHAVDTVAAGDAFNGGLAVALAESKSIATAAKFATATAALSVMQRGAQPSMPIRQQVEAFLTDKA